jgi:hypothetical protein
LENLLILLNNRNKDKLIFISQNPISLVSAINQDFLTIPMVKYETFHGDDFQLALVENYMVTLKLSKNVPTKIINDFKFLVQKVDKQILKKNQSSDQINSE